ncbi:MAG: helix-turn-helix transcriptional regulator [Bacilli bacterium]|jgi:transcriptional regulator with XRE-family HTH domain|nr:helix-turn-helix transcriptional regulator [Bacilli bacterium]MCX4255004.1 helix-turn-helix transcriptional regulator [Bacilli bacterium]
MLYNERLTELRENKNKKQYEIADVIGIYKGVYNEYEREYTIIPIKHLSTLCNYFNVSIDYIFSFSDIPNYKNAKSINKEISKKRLKELRKDNKITQEQLAKQLNISRTTITEYERGTNIIATPFLYEICKTYLISADYLLGKTDSPKYYK